MSDWYVIPEDGRNVRVAVAEDAHATWVFVNGDVWRLERQSGATRPRARHDTSVMAPMPATVVAIHTAPGRTVKDGDTVIVLEAMKMELPVKAPKAGVVRAVNCAEGELVQPGVNLIEID